MTAFDVRLSERAGTEDAAAMKRLPGLLSKWTTAPDPNARNIRMPLMADWLRVRDRDTVARLTLIAYEAAPAAAKARLLRLATETGTPAALEALTKAAEHL